MKREAIIVVFFAAAVFGLSNCSGKEAVKEEHLNHNATIEDSLQSDRVVLTKRDEQYANISIDTVKKKDIAEYTTLLGTTSIDERKITVITSRVRGRLDKLFVKNPQQWVTTGQPLYSIYSEELLSDENEFITALQQQNQFNTMKPVMDKLMEGTRKKLLLWGLTGDQVAELEKKGTASPFLTFKSPTSGTVIELPVSEGQYVETGSPLFKVADLSQLWIEAQMYSNELKWLHEKPTIKAEFDAYPGESFSVIPIFDNPTVEADQKISLVRFLVANHKLPLKPGMMAYVNIKRNEKKAMVVPKSSLVVGNMITAWVKISDGIYENRMIQLGIQNKKEVEVLSGLEEGEVIVTNGAYLLNSALILKKGAGMPGMGGMKM